MQQANATAWEVCLNSLQAGNANDPLLGRTFLTSAYLLVDNERSQVSLWQAQPTVNENVIVVAAAGSCASSTSSAASAAASGTSASSASASAAASMSSNTPIGAIIGGAVGGVLLIILVVVEVMFFLRRQNRASSGHGNPSRLVPDVGDSNGIRDGKLYTSLPPGYQTSPEHAQHATEMSGIVGPVELGQGEHYELG